MTMIVAKLLSPGRIELVHEEVPILMPDQVLIKTRFVGICGTDHSIYTGQNKFLQQGLIELPLVMGHEWSGVISDVGDEVKVLKVGDRVVGDGEVSCGQCGACLYGDYSNCANLRGVGTINAWSGAYAEYFVMPEKHVHKVPDTVDLKVASLTEPAAIALKAMQGAGNLFGKTVLIFGTGPIGLASAHLARFGGANRIIVCGRKANKLRIAKEMGADFTINVIDTELHDSVMELTAGLGVDVILEGSGSLKALFQAMAMVTHGGTLLLPSFYARSVDGVDFDDLILRNIRIQGSCGSIGVGAEILQLMKVDDSRFNKMITHVFPLTAVDDAFEAMDDPSRIKILMEIGEE